MNTTGLIISGTIAAILWAVPASAQNVTDVTKNKVGLSSLTTDQRLDRLERTLKEIMAWMDLQQGPTAGTTILGDIRDNKIKVLQKQVVALAAVIDKRH
jgi:hypothetical protein